MKNKDLLSTVFFLSLGFLCMGFCSNNIRCTIGNYNNRAENFEHNRQLKSWSVELSDKRIINFLMSTEVKIYLDDLFQILKENSIYRNNIDWNFIQSELYLNASGAFFIFQAQKSVLNAFNNLGDNHSYLVNEDFQKQENENIKKQLNKNIEYGFINKNTVYIKLPPASSSSFLYADKLQKIIKQLSKKKPLYWVLDLRGNSGGNIWEMLLGLSPLLGDGTYGYFGNGENDFLAWTYNKGKLSLKNDDTNHLITFVKKPFLLKKSPKKIALLIDEKTASSAEAVVIAFKSKENVITFGSKTCGAATATTSFKLQSGSTLFLAVSYFFDCNKINYPNGIYPDVNLSNSTSEADFLASVNNFFEQ